MTRRAGAVLFLAMALLWLVANRGAYKGYFQDDELDNISWTRDVTTGDFAWNLITPKFLGNNFRPVGHFFYRAMAGLVGLDFPKYVAVVHALHLLNAWLVWLLARRLGADLAGAAAGTLMFAFHMALFDAYWKPMYIFDVLCALFSLACLLFYSHKRYALSFCAFWLAYKSKELAVMLPAVLACYEYWFGGRRWRQLAPFFAVSISFGMQGILLNPNADNDYTLRFTPAAAWKSIQFYSRQVLLVPYAGLALAALPWIFKDRRVWFGTAAMGLFFLPLLFLPGRLYGAYCYLPFTGLALVWGRAPSLSALLFCLLWIPWNYSHLRKLRSHALFVGEQNRAYVTTLQDFARSTPGIGAFAYDGAPAELHRWGIEGALRYLYPGAHPRLVSVEDRGAEEVMRSQSVALLNWDAQTRRLMILARKADTPDVSYIRMDPRTPLWQLGGGWYRLEGGFRWTQPRATARLQRPATTTEFELTVNIGPDLIREIGGTRVRVRVAGQPAGSREFTRSGWQTVRWPLEPAPAGGVEVEFQVEPEYHPANGDPRRLGIAIGAFGFRP